jgi:hypothetical protein
VQRVQQLGVKSMSTDAFFRSVGGKRVLFGADGEPVYNFGIATASGALATDMSQVPDVRGRRFADVAPRAYGRWDGKTSVSNWLATEKVLGSFLGAQAQKIGSCGGAATSGGLNVQQCVQIAAGKQQGGYKPVSRAWCYVGARIKTGTRGRGEGVIPPSPLEWVKEKGTVHLEEITGEDYGHDELAKKWDRSGLPQDLYAVAADNIIEAMAPVYSFQEAADVIFGGGVVMVASDAGFSMTRDRDGFCARKGRWMHYMYFGAVVVSDSGRRGLGCGQSWGKNTPSGPLLKGCPDYVFGVSEDDVNYMLKQRDSTGVASFKGWGESYDPWVF